MKSPFGQWTHEPLRNGFDLWQTLRAENYNLSSPWFEIKLRGHVAEQDVYDQLNVWAGDRMQIPQASNNPYTDLTLDGQGFNVKVGADTSTISEHLRNHPDIPVLVNEDMDGLPDDALHLDLSQPFEPEMLGDHSVIVAEGLSLSGIQDQMADALGHQLDSYDFSDAIDQMGDILPLPVLGSIICVVRSGIREGRLAAEHGDTGRAVRSVARDVTIVGFFVSAGGAIGMATDFAGLTFGAGQFIGPGLGGVLGNRLARNQRIRPLNQAQQDSAVALERYGEEVQDRTAWAKQAWETVDLPWALDFLSLAREEAITRLERVGEGAQSDLLSIRGAFTTDVAGMLREAEGDVLAAARPAIIDQVLRRRWLAVAESDTSDSLLSKLDLLAASRRHDAELRRLLWQSSQQRAQITSAVVASAALATQDLARARLIVNSGLSDRRAERRREAEVAIHGRLMDLWLANERVRKELVATGAKERAWVDEHFPTVEPPAAPSTDFEGG